MGEFYQDDDVSLQLDFIKRKKEEKMGLKSKLKGIGKKVGLAALDTIPAGRGVSSLLGLNEGGGGSSGGGIMGAVNAAIGGGGGGGGGGKRRSRSMYIRKGRVFMGFSQKEVKNAMRRRYGGGKR